MENKTKGKIVDIFQTQQISDKFKKREFVIETDEQYPQLIKMEFVQDNCSKLDSFAIGQDVEVYFNLRGRKWTNKEGKDNYFITLSVWRMVEAGTKTEIPTLPQTPPKSPEPIGDSDDLPF